MLTDLFLNRAPILSFRKCTKVNKPYWAGNNPKPTEYLDSFTFIRIVAHLPSECLRCSHTYLLNAPRIVSRSFSTSELFFKPVRSTKYTESHNRYRGFIYSTFTDLSLILESIFYCNQGRSFQSEACLSAQTNYTYIHYKHV